MKNLLLVATLLLISVNAPAAESPQSERTKAEKIQELLMVEDMDSMVDNMYSEMEAMLQNMAVEMGVQPSEQPLFDRYYNQMILILKTEMSWEKMEPQVVDVYTRLFSEREVEDMLSFYKTESGRSIVKKMPEVMSEAMQISQSLVQGTLPQIQKIAEEFGEDLMELREKQSAESGTEE